MTGAGWPAASGPACHSERSEESVPSRLTDVDRAVDEQGHDYVRSYWRKVWAVARKDLLIELRSRDVLSSAVVFTLLVLLIFNFAIDLTGDVVRAVAPGVLWVTFIFAGMLTLGRTFARERERGALQGLMLAPIDRG